MKKDYGTPEEFIQKYKELKNTDKMAVFYKVSATSIRNHAKKIGFDIIGNEPLKLTVAPKSFGYTGYELAAILEKHNIICEFADPDFIVFMLTPETRKEGLERLYSAFLGIDRREPVTAFPPAPSLKVRRLTPKQSLLSPFTELPIEKCIGKIAADVSVNCPPAVPIIICGEEIDENAAAAFKYYGVSKLRVIDGRLINE